MFQWAPACAIQSLRSNSWLENRPHDLILCVTDHFEPGHNHVTPQVAAGRVESWCEKFPSLFSAFRDSDGVCPQHTFFYPLEMYQRNEVARIADLCRAGFGEVEIHLHHQDDTSENLRRTLTDYCALLRAEHGLLCQDKTGRARYAFIHGVWALDNSQPDGSWCGVNNELDILRETGCYADFTLPSYPSRAQTRKINSVYYAVDDPLRPKSHDWGQNVGDGAQPANSLMLIQGPLILNFHSRKFGLIPRVENGNLQKGQPPTPARVDLWLKARVGVPTRPDWLFVKLYTHGAPEWNQQVVLGPSMVALHEELARRSKANSNFRYHYVTARQMYNLVRAAEAGWKGSVNEAREFELVWKK